MSSVKHFPLKALVVALATSALAGGCATNVGPVGVNPVRDSSRTNTTAVPLSRVAQPPAPVAVAPAPQAAAPAPAPEPQEKTVVVMETTPPNAKPGECYTKVMLPAEFRDEPVQQVVRAAGERTEYTEPVYEEVEE